MKKWYVYLRGRLYTVCDCQHQAEWHQYQLGLHYPKHLIEVVGR